MNPVRLHDPITPSIFTLAMGFIAGAALTWGFATAAARWRDSGKAPDDAVASRAALRLRQLVDRPDEVEVTVEQGVVRLAGRVREEERDRLLTSLLAVPGVVRVRNALSTFPSGPA